MHLAVKIPRLPLLFISLWISLPLFAQGPLAPPAGAPAPSMKTLEQIEPRRPISSLPAVISQPGSYYFTKSLVFTAASGPAISIQANDVTLDLMGFTLSSSNSVTGVGILVFSTVRNVSIRNGVIAGNTTVTVTGTPPSQTWTVSPAGFSVGIDGGSHFSHLRISGCRGFGLNPAEHAVIAHVTAGQNGSHGISALSSSITNCSAVLNGDAGIQASSGSVTNCTVTQNKGAGIFAPEGTVTNCSAMKNGLVGVFAHAVANTRAAGNGGDGIGASAGSVTNCAAKSNAGHGISASSGTVTNSLAQSNGNDGIAAASGVVAFCRASSNNVNNNGSIDIDAVGATRTGNNPTP